MCGGTKVIGRSEIEPWSSNHSTPVGFDINAIIFDRDGGCDPRFELDIDSEAGSQGE